MSDMGGRVSDLSSAEKKEIEVIMAEVGKAIRDLQAINRPHLATIIYRRRISSDIDGHSSNRRPKPGFGGGDSSSTEAAALSGLPDDESSKDDWSRHSRSDPQQGAVDRFFSALRGNGPKHPGALSQAATARSAMLFIITTGEKERGRPDKLDYCDLCGGPVSGAINDQMRSGLGPRCHSRFNKFKAKYGKQLGEDTKTRFRVERQAEILDGSLRCGETPSAPAKVRVIPGAIPVHVDPDDLEALKSAGVK